VNETTYLLIATAGATALFHTLIPDHWLPFVLVARSQNWSLRKTFLTTLISALFHVALSLGLGILALFLGREFIIAVGERMELFAGWALAFFGVVYTLYFLFGSGQHQHYFPGHGEHHPHEDYETKDDSETKSPSRPHILHRHLGDRPWGALTLAAVVGLNPCVLAIPLVFATIAEDRWALLGVSVSFALTSIIVLVSASLLAFKGLRHFRLNFLNKYGEVISGLLLTLVGLLMILLESRH
jgi:nickel/cobalt exporter